MARETRFEAIVVGGGPAGLAAGLQLSRAGYRTLLVESDAPGGQARRLPWIENYPGFPAGVRGAELMAAWFAQARRWGLGWRRARAAAVVARRGGFDVKLAGGRPLRSRAVVWSTGARFKELGLPGERRLRERGVFHAPLDEAPLFRGRSVAVVGAGEAAVHQAVLLAGYARRVYLLNRGRALGAHRLLRRRAAAAVGLVHLRGVTVAALLGDRRLEGVVVRRRGGRRRTLRVSALFVLIGMEGGPPRRRAPAPGFFVAGDASGTPCRQVLVAGGRGMEAAMACIRHLERGA